MLHLTAWASARIDCIDKGGPGACRYAKFVVGGEQGARVGPNS